MFKNNKKNAVLLGSMKLNKTQHIDVAYMHIGLTCKQQHTYNPQTLQPSHFITWDLSWLQSQHSIVYEFENILK